MRIITQISLFDDTLNENLGDLERLQKVLANLPEEESEKQDINWHQP